MADEKTPTNATDWNAAIVAQAVKEGIKPEEIEQKLRITEEAPVAAKAEEKKTEPAVLSQTFEVNGKSLTFSGATQEEVLKQAVAAYSAAAPAPAPVKVEPPKKKELTSEEMFAIGRDLMTGKPEAIREYIQKSDILDSYFKDNGVDIAKLSESTKKAIESETTGAWEAATKEFLAKPGNDYPGGEINKVVLGTKIAQMGLGNKPTVESIQAAYDDMKKNNLVHRPVQEQKVETKKANPGSSVFGKGAETTTRQPAEVTKLTQAEFAKMTPQQLQAWTNGLLEKGVNPESVVIQ